MPAEAKLIFRLTRSQQMALADILVHYALMKDQPQNFIDLAEDTTTTTGELLHLFTDPREWKIDRASEQKGSNSAN